MVGIALLFLILHQFSFSYSNSDLNFLDVLYSNEVNTFTTEGVPFVAHSNRIDQSKTKSESYCKGWCRDWLPSERRHKYKKHIACNNNEDFSSSCKYPGMVEMFPDRKAHIISRHNSIRNNIAIGQMKPKFEEAARMPLIKWDDELARLASLNVKKCKFEVDFCFDKENYEHFGQNIAIWDTSYGPVNYTLLIDEMFRNWQRNEKYNFS